MPNKDIKVYAFEKNVKMYQIAKELGIHYVTLNAKLRNKLTKEETQKIIDIIDKLEKEKNNGY